MNIFVAAWYYPPVTSSEGIVTYKLLRKSGHRYDVASSLSENWSYHTSFKSYDEPNINTYTIDTDSIDEWVNFCVDKFEELYPEQKYDCIMTRSTPPESILVGTKIKERHPEVKWIASLADPVANNPYEIKIYVEDNPLLNSKQKKQLKEALKSGDKKALEKWEKRPENGIQILCELREWESAVLEKADLIISPTERQLSFIDGDTGWKSKYFAVPHSYATDFYTESERADDGKIIFTYTGYSDNLRSLEPIVNAVNHLVRCGSPVLDRILFRFVGNTPRDIKDKIYNFGLYPYIRVESSVDYYDSLKLMKESDWLIHVDAYFEGLEPGGSIFFAGKIADYMGAGKPIFALTGENTPAARIVEKAGGIVLDSKDYTQIADAIEEICIGKIAPALNNKYIEEFDSVKVAKRFDARLDELCSKGYTKRTSWQIREASDASKLLTICVPSYNVQRCLDRCLDSLISCKNASLFDVVVVDDGSKDCTLDIARSYEEHYPGIVRVIHKENGGHGSTINAALEVAVGKYFRVLDSDDWVDSVELDKVINQIVANNIDTDIIHTNYHIVNLEKGTSAPILQDFAVNYNTPLALEDIDTKRAYFTMAGSMFKLSVLKEMNTKLHEHTFYVDVEFILYPIPFVKTVYYIDSFVYKYSQGSNEQSVHVPNMVKRYPDHDTVVRSVVDYRSTHTMDQAQAEYYDSILKRVLYTHYALGLVYDEDRDRGYRRAKNFDEYLINTAPDLAKWAGLMPIVRAARKYGYDHKKVRMSFGTAVNFAKQITKRGIVRHKGVAKKLLMNKYVYKVSNSKFFESGKGLALKNKLMYLLLQ